MEIICLAQQNITQMGEGGLPFPWFPWHPTSGSSGGNLHKEIIFIV